MGDRLLRDAGRSTCSSQAACRSHLAGIGVAALELLVVAVGACRGGMRDDSVYLIRVTAAAGVLLCVLLSAPPPQLLRTRRAPRRHVKGGRPRPPPVGWVSV